MSGLKKIQENIKQNFGKKKLIKPPRLQSAPTSQQGNKDQLLY